MNIKQLTEDQKCLSFAVCMVLGIEGYIFFWASSIIFQG